MDEAPSAPVRPLKKIALEGDKHTNNTQTTRIQTLQILDQHGPEGRVGEKCTCVTFKESWVFLFKVEQQTTSLEHRPRFDFSSFYQGTELWNWFKFNRKCFNLAQKVFFRELDFNQTILQCTAFFMKRGGMAAFSKAQGVIPTGEIKPFSEILRLYLSDLGVMFRWLPVLRYMISNKTQN